MSDYNTFQIQELNDAIDSHLGKNNHYHADSWCYCIKSMIGVAKLQPFSGENLSRFLTKSTELTVLQSAITALQLKNNPTGSTWGMPANQIGVVKELEELSEQIKEAQSDLHKTIQDKLK